VAFECGILIGSDPVFDRVLYQSIGQNRERSRSGCAILDGVGISHYSVVFIQPRCNHFGQMA
jgi:hypothetical protein